MRSINEIQQIILEKQKQIPSLAALEVLTDSEKQELSHLENTSKVGLWRNFIYIISFAIFSCEQLFLIFKKEVDKKVSENKVHNFPWYKKKALAFQYGHALIPETDQYDNTGITVKEIVAAKIIKHASVVRKIVKGRGFLEMKIAKEENGKLTQLTESEIQAFSTYMFLVADAGTYIQYVSLPADDFKITLEIHYDPQILWNDGSRKDGKNNAPVIEAINDYLYNLEFNGELILTKLTDRLQRVEGVEIPKIRNAAAKYGGYDYQEIDETYLARAGYMILDKESTDIKYVAREVY